MRPREEGAWEGCVVEGRQTVMGGEACVDCAAGGLIPSDSIDETLRTANPSFNPLCKPEYRV